MGITTERYNNGKDDSFWAHIYDLYTHVNTIKLEIYKYIVKVAEKGTIDFMSLHSIIGNTKQQGKGNKNVNINDKNYISNFTQYVENLAVHVSNAMDLCAYLETASNFCFLDKY